jgi:hypothetical protein
MITSVYQYGKAGKWGWDWQERGQDDERNEGEDTVSYAETRFIAERFELVYYRFSHDGLG